MKELSRGLSRGDAIKAGLATVFSLLAYPLARDIDNSRHIFNALTGQRVDCSPDGEFEANPTWDAIVVPGGGMKKNPNGTYAPNEFEELRLEAAAIEYIGGKAPFIILLNGVSNPEADGNVIKEYLKKQVKKLSAGKKKIEDKNIIVENISVDTFTNMEQLEIIVQEKRLENILMVSNFFHIKRATANSCAFDISTTARSAETAIINFNPQRKAEILDYYRSRNLEEIMQNEYLALIYALFDPQGYYAQDAKRFLGLR